MNSDASALKPLTRSECLRLMASVPVGRIVYTRQALPAVELVNFALDKGDIVVRTDRGGKLAGAIRGAVDIRISPEILNGRRLSAAGSGHPHQTPVEPTCG